MDAPERIWLQNWLAAPQLIETTWCNDKIHDDDIEYVRADIVNQLVEALMSAQALLASCPFMYDPQMIDSGVHRMMHKISEALEAAKGQPHETT